MYVLVTGGAGFIGSNIVEALLDRDERVRVLDNFSTGKRENLLPFKDAIDIVEGDIRSYHTVKEAVEGIDVIMHQAALPSVPRSIKDPITTNDVNVGGTLHILEAARDAGVKRIVYASSSSVYGNSAELPKREDMTPDPLSPYAVSKLAAERYCQVFSLIYGIETVCLRYFNVFGPRQDPNSQYSAVIPKFIRAMIQGEQPVVYGDGEQSRDFTYVENIVEANLHAAAAECESGLVLNCACNEQTTINQLINEMNLLLGTALRPRYVPSRAGEVRDSIASIDRAKSAIGYNPKTGFREGLRKTVEWYKHGIEM